jgi:hypothetical protein
MGQRLLKNAEYAKTITENVDKGYVKKLSMEEADQL